MAKRQQETEEVRNLKRLFRRWNWLGATEEYFAMVRRRIGETPEDRLAWVLRVAQQDPSTRRRGEEVILGEDLRVCAFLALRRTGGYRVPLDDMSKADLEGYLTAIDAGLRNVLAKRPWVLSAEPHLVALDEGGFSIRFSGDERAGILGGIAHLVVEVGDRLRACQECGVPFVAKMRQSRYHNEACRERHWNKQRDKEGGRNG